MQLHIKILYGSSWGFPQRYEELASLLSRKIKTTKLTISGRKVNRKAAFEIFFNDVCVHSKIESGEMPNFDAVLDHAKDFIEGKVDEPHVIENTETCTCRFQSCCYVSWSKFYIELWREVFSRLY